MTEEDFKNYFALFNGRQYDKFTKYYADDVLYVMDAMENKIFHGPQAIADLYKELHQYFDEEVSIENIAISDSMIAVSVPTLLTCTKDFHLDGFIPLDKGDVCEMVCFNHYDLNDEGKISRIRVSIHYMKTHKNTEN